ncbi:MAG TPA: bifunctional 5,10-methylene-tetrahydrofolate dehydrogenase/5,10-methylene-tetrahydrofolate cyclohydrolase, partial [Candidatus Dorea intestinavium]|nr:bifunctional 5,10-methylene-tetrahydrofolate dehydrogenase/5,10-methylene-tetrahydrofolate cyclohydrolase [Candidatus Dorea intestinavium]
DVAFAEVEKIATYISPVPGGVGSVTSSVLAEHVIKAAEANS